MKKVCAFLGLLLMLHILFSCSGYEKLLKSNDFNLKYKKAFEYYNKGDYTKASTLFDQIAPYYRGTSKADSVFFYQAMSTYKQNDFILAGEYFRKFVETYNKSQFIEDAYFYIGLCHYMESPRPELDQTETQKAIEAFNLFLVKFPNSTYKDRVRNLINELHEKLVEKSYLSAKLYYDLEDYKAAIISLNNSLMEYPESKYREEIQYLLVKSKYLLAVNSIESKKAERFQEAVDEYFSFISEFPESKYKKEVQKMYNESLKYIKTQNDIKAENIKK